MELHSRVVCCVLAVGLLSASVRAQQIGLPVLQNAFLNAGATVGIDYGTGDNANAFGVAAAWAPSSALFQLSGGLGVYDPDLAAHSTAWGVRVMAPAPRLGGRSYGLAALIGVGGTSVNGVTEFRVPAGLSIGYRHVLDATHSVSGYATPFYSWSRMSSGGVSSTNGLLRVSFGVDVVVLPGLGVTVGYETGSTASHEEPGPEGGIFGLGVSYALRRP